MENKKDTKQNNHLKEQDEIKFAEKLDEEAFEVIKRLYDKTFKELVDR